MKKLIMLLILLGIFGGCYFLLWPGPSEKLYRENRGLFAYDGEAPLDLQTISTQKYRSFEQIDLTYASPSGGRVPATIFAPAGQGPYPAIILMHGMPGNRQHMTALAHQYVRAGALVMAIDAPHARDSSGARPTLYFSTVDRADQIQLILDLRRAIDLLGERADVDPDRLAYVGISYGGAMGGLLAGVEDRIKAYVLVVGDGGLVSHFTGPDNLFGALSVEMDKNERRAWIDSLWPIEPLHYIGHAEPAALLFQSARSDQSVSLDDTLRYYWAGSQPKKMVWYDSGHWPLPDDYLRDQADWLAQHIGIDSGAID